MNVNRRSLIAALALTASASLALPPMAHAQYNLTLCGASPGGLWSLLGAGIDGALKESMPGATVTYQTSGGGFANVAQLDQGKCDLAIIHDAEATAAIKGEQPFKTPVKSMRTVAVLYTWAPEQFIVRKDFADEHGITTMADIATNKVPIRILLNRRGNVVSAIGESMLEASGASIKDIESWGGSVTFAASKEQGEMMRDRRADALLNSLFINHRSIKQLASAIDVVLIPISEDAADKVSREWAINPMTIPAAAYDWNDDDVLTVTVSAQLFVREDADPKMVTDLTTALVEHISVLQGVHKAMAPLDTKLLAGAKAVPYHPAAAAVYKAKGLQ